MIDKSPTKKILHGKKMSTYNNLTWAAIQDHDQHHTSHPAQSEKIFLSSYDKINNHTDKSKCLITK